MTPTDAGTTKMYAAFERIRNGVYHKYPKAAEEVVKVSLLDNGSERILFTRIHP